MLKFYRLSNNRQITKFESITKQDCLKNFIEIFGKENLFIIADNVKEESIVFINQLNIKYEKISLGNSGSFIYALDRAVMQNNDEEIVYFVEDDYLHLSIAPKLIEEGIRFSDYISLYDHPDKYMGLGENNPYPNLFVKDGGEDTKVIISESSHWKFTNSTTMTFASKVKTLKKDYEILKKHCNLMTGFPHDFEMFCELREKGRKLITPIPACSTHCDSRYLSPFVDWKKLC